MLWIRYHSVKKRPASKRPSDRPGRADDRAARGVHGEGGAAARAGVSIERLMGAVRAEVGV